MAKQKSTDIQNSRKGSGRDFKWDQMRKNTRVPNGAAGPKPNPLDTKKLRNAKPPSRRAPRPGSGPLYPWSTNAERNRRGISTRAKRPLKPSTHLQPRRSSRRLKMDLVVRVGAPDV